MNLINWLFSGLFVPKSQYENARILAKTYLDQVEDLEVKLSGNENRWRSLEKDLAKSIETNRLITSYVKQIGLASIFDEVSDADLQTDRFYQILLNAVKATCDNRRELAKELRIIGAIALQDGNFEGASSLIDREEIGLIKIAIADLRGKAADLSEENAELTQDLRTIGAISLRYESSKDGSLPIDQEEITRRR